MKRSNPFLSPLGWSISLVLFIILGIFTVIQGGMLFTPGEVSAKSQPGVVLGGFESHVDFESQCDLCHRPLETTQDTLCITCHEGIELQLDSGAGTHAQMKNISDCAYCHAEHKGRDFDPTETAARFFDHSVTAFSLDKHAFDYEATLLSCEGCHGSEENFNLIVGVCEDCHTAYDQVFMQQHDLDFGPDCLACHNGLDSMAQFNHRETTFPLDGQHTLTRCAVCHIDNQFVDLDTNCAACHAEPEIHRNYYDLNCNTCHTSLAWTPAIMDGVAFNHEKDTSFSLVRHQKNYDSANITCAACHPQNTEDFSTDQCVQCHTQDSAFSMEKHSALFGASCLGCHDGIDRMSAFNHSDFFTLEGQHDNLDCGSCHIDHIFQGTANECWQCHAEPEIHIGYFGTQCEICHTSQAWHPARISEHIFPLDHGEENLIQCDVCHTNAYVEYTCYGCHEHQPDDIEHEHDEENITTQELLNCINCHPAGEKDEHD